MISIVMPYWNRPTALEKNLPMLEAQYGGKLPIEVIIPDDCSEEYPATVTESYSFPVTVIRMPKKRGRKNPCLSFIVGISHAVGEMILITNPETSHVGAILFEMKAALEELGPTAAVTPRVTSKDENSWYVHEEKSLYILPFCMLMYTEHYWACGGHDIDYRDVMAFDDSDLMMRLARKGTKVCIMKDLYADHHKDWCDGHTKWIDLEEHARRGQEIFRAKWNKDALERSDQEIVVA